MNMLRVAMIFSFVALSGLQGCTGQIEDTQPGQPVKTRQVAFQEILKVFEPMGVMLRTNQYEPERFAALAAELLTVRNAPWFHFGPDTNYPPTKAQAIVWTQSDEFEAKKSAFFAATDALNTAAQTKEKDLASPAYFKAYDTCKSCHDQFKKR
jgi:cytochrome c556